MAQQSSTTTSGRTHFVTSREASAVRRLLQSFALSYTIAECRRYVSNIESDLRAQGENEAARALVKMFARN